MSVDMPETNMAALNWISGCDILSVSSLARELSSKINVWIENRELSLITLFVVCLTVEDDKETLLAFQSLQSLMV